MDDGDHVGCLACDLATGRRPLPGGRILERAGWVVEHCVGPLGVGTLLVKPLRHVVHVGELDDEEAVALGPLLRETSAVAAELTGADQVYVCLWSHAGGVPGHVHFVVMPVTQALRAAHDGALGPDLQSALFAAGVGPDPAAVEALAERARVIWPGASRARGDGESRAG